MVFIPPLVSRGREPSEVPKVPTGGDPADTGGFTGAPGLCEDRGHELLARRTARTARRPRRRRAPRHGLLHRRARPRGRRPAGGLRHLRAPRVEPEDRRSTRRTSSPPRRRSATTAGSRATTARCSSGATPTASPSRPGPRALEVLVANDVDRARRRPTTATPRRRPSRTRSSRANRGRSGRPTAGRAGSPTASSSPRRTTRPRDGGFKYNPPHGGPADSDATTVIAAARQRAASAAGLDGRRAGAVRPGPGRGRAAYDFLGTYVDDLPSVLDIDAIRAAGVRIGVDPLGGAAVDYWGAIARAARARPDRRQPARRPDAGAS